MCLSSLCIFLFVCSRVVFYFLKTDFSIWLGKMTTRSPSLIFLLYFFLNFMLVPSSHPEWVTDLALNKVLQVRGWCAQRGSVLVKFPLSWQRQRDRGECMLPAQCGMRPLPERRSCTSRSKSTVRAREHTRLHCHHAIIVGLTQLFLKANINVAAQR